MDTPNLLKSLNQASTGTTNKDDTDHAELSLLKSIMSPNRLSSFSMFKTTGNVKSMMRLRRQSKLDLQTQMENRLMGGDLLIENKSKVEEVEEEEEEEDVECMKTAHYNDSDTFHNMSTDEIKENCSSIVKLYHSVTNIQSEQDNATMFGYIQQVFADHVDKDTIDSYVQKASTEKPSLILKCKIIKANNLLAKDANGKSDPYCIICTLNKQHIDSKLVHNHNMDEWIKNKIIDGAHRTSVKQETLDPIWNESFEIIINDPREEYLVIELWDSDEEQRTKVKGFKGLGRLIADMKKEDDFLGRVFYLLQHVPVGGGEKTLELLSHSTKHSRGTITVWMDVIGQMKETEEEAHLTYKRLLQCVVVHESKDDNGDYIRRWNGKISEIGEKLLSQCAAIYSITPLQQTAIRLSVLMNYNKAFAIDVHALSDVLQSIQLHSDAQKSTSFWFEQLETDMKELLTYIMDIMRQHLDIFNNFKSAESIVLLKSHLLVCHDLYQIKLFKQQLSNEQLDLKLTLTNAIQAAVPHWMLIISANFMPAFSSSEQAIVAFKGICAHCLKQCQRSYDKVHPAFQEVGVDYFSPFFMSLDKLLHMEAKSRLDECSKETALIAYEIYHIIKKISKYANEIDPEFLKKHNLPQPSITKFHTWFKGWVSEWIAVAQCKAKERLVTAIKLDTIVKYSDRATFSSSAVDTHAFFLQVISFWNDLQWPDRAQSIGYFTIVIQSLVDMAIYYADQIFTKLQPEDFVDSQSGRFVVTDKLCITLNNIHHVSNVLNDIGSELHLPAYYKWLDEEKQEGDGPPLSERAKTLINEVLQSANEDILNKTNAVIDTVRTRLFPTIIAFIPKLMQAAVDVPPDKVLEPMLNYVMENMGKLGEALLTPIFLNILNDLWIKVIVALREAYDKVSHTSRNHLKRLNYIVLNLSDFFEAGGNGLTRNQIEKEEYTSLRDELFFAILSTDDIIRKFCYDLVKQQVISKQLLGKLHMCHRYNPAKKKLVVEIVSAESIPALDRTGKSDPYIQLFLFPTTAFVTASEFVYKTSVKKQTLDPIYNETLEIPADSEELKKDGAILLMAMFDYDLLSSDDFAGLCVIPCNSTPLEEGNEPKVEHLNLFHYKETRAFKELEKRSGDQVAGEFLKFIKKLVCEEGTHRSFNKFRYSITHMHGHSK